MKTATYDLAEPSAQSGLSLAPPDTLPATASGQEFARLLDVSQPLVSRWRSEGRLRTDPRGQIDVPASLVALAATLDPSRGGRKGTQRNGGTLDRIQALIRRYAGAAGSQSAADQVEVLRRRVSELEWQLHTARNAFMDDQAGRIAEFTELLLPELPRLAALTREDADEALDALTGRVFYDVEPEDMGATD